MTINKRFIKDNNKLHGWAIIQKELDEVRNESFKQGYWKGSADERKKFLDLLGVDPLDVFPEISNEQLRIINELLFVHLGFHLDRLSAHIIRLKNKEIKQALGREA